MRKIKKTYIFIIDTEEHGSAYPCYGYGNNIAEAWDDAVKREIEELAIDEDEELYTGDPITKDGIMATIELKGIVSMDINCGDVDFIGIINEARIIKPSI